jgi:hypothetical protein
MEAQNYNKVASIVDQFCLKKGLSSSHWFAWSLAMGLWHLRELKLDAWQDVKTELLPITSRRTVTLPTGFVDWVKVGVPYGQYVITMGLNEDLNTLNRNQHDISPVAGLLKDNLPHGLDFSNYNGIGHSFSNYNGSSIDSAGGGQAMKGYFKVVERPGYKELLLDYDFTASEIYLEYITDGFDPCGETILNPHMCDFFLKGMELSYEEEKNPNRTEASIYRKGRELFFAGQVVRARKNNLDPKTMLTLSRKHVRFTPQI